MVLDENVLAEGRTYCSVYALKPSPSHELLMYTVDTTGNEDYEVLVVDIASGQVLVLSCLGSLSTQLLRLSSLAF